MVEIRLSGEGEFEVSLLIIQYGIELKGWIVGL